VDVQVIALVGIDPCSSVIASMSMHIHCASAGSAMARRSRSSVTATITLQAMTRVSLSLSAALIGFVEASDRTRDEKNGCAGRTLGPTRRSTGCGTS